MPVARPSLAPSQVALVLDWNPPPWQPLGIDAYLRRLAPLQRLTDAGAGGELGRADVDSKLWGGAFGEGWRVHAANANNDGGGATRAVCCPHVHLRSSHGHCVPVTSPSHDRPMTVI